MITSASARTSSSIVALAGDRGRDALVAGVERMAVARLREAPDEDLVVRLEEEDLGLDVPALERAQGGPERERRVAGAHVQHERHAPIPLRVVGDQLREVTQQVAGHVVHDRVAEVLEQLAGGGLARAREPRDDRHVLAAGGGRGGLAPAARTAAASAPSLAHGVRCRPPVGSGTGLAALRCPRESIQMVNSYSRYITAAHHERADGVAARGGHDREHRRRPG